LRVGPMNGSEAGLRISRWAGMRHENLRPN
jgi:hypothetical protein